MMSLAAASGSPRTDSAAASRRLTPFDIEAHRGGRALHPENTLPSFANALSMGVDTLELDMGVTRDGIVIVSHERGLNPDLARGLRRALRHHGDSVRQTHARGGQAVRRRPDPTGERLCGEVSRSARGARRPAFRPSPRCLRSCAARATAMCGSTSRPRSTRRTREESPDPQHFVAAVLDLLRREQFSDRVHDPVLRLADAASRSRNRRRRSDRLSHAADRARRQ